MYIKQSQYHAFAMNWKFMRNLKQVYNIEQDEEEEEDSKVEQFATMAEQIEKQRLQDLAISSEESSEEEDEKDNGPDIFADDMALGEEASTLESHPSKSDENIKISSVVINKGLRKPYQAFQPRKK